MFFSITVIDLFKVIYENYKIYDIKFTKTLQSIRSSISKHFLRIKHKSLLSFKKMLLVKKSKLKQNV